MLGPPAGFVKLHPAGNAIERRSIISRAIDAC
jgi:hypothetical protein